MKQARRVLGGAACAATVVGLLLPMEAAVAEAGPCPGTTVGSTYSLSGDCVLTQTWVVDAGGTIDGNGFTISLDSTFTGGAAIESAPGTTGGTAPIMNVKHVTLDAAGAGTGVLFSGATGAVHQVTITGGAGTDYGIQVDNTVGADFGAALVTIDKGTTIGSYQKAAVYVRGNAKFKVYRSHITSPLAVPGQALAGVQTEEGAHGFIDENTIDLSGVSPASQGAFGAGVRIVGDPSATAPLRVEVKRNVFTGTVADFAVSVESANSTVKTTATVDCNLFRRNDPRTSTDDTYGVAVGQWVGGKVNVKLTNSTFEGNWNHTTGNISGNTVSLPGPANTNAPNVKCAPTAPTHVVASGGDRQSKVTWHASTTSAWAPALSGYTVRAKAAGHPTVAKTVGATATSARLTGLRNGVSYTVTVTARSNGGAAAGTTRLYATKVHFKAKPGRIHRGHKAVLRGRLTSMNPKAHLGKRHVAIWAKPKGHHWRQITTVRTKSDGTFALRVKPHKRTAYRAFYAGHPDLAAAHKTKVVVRR